MEHVSDGDTESNYRARYSQQLIGIGTGGIGNKRMSPEHPNDKVVEISQNTKKSPRDLRKIVATQNPVKTIS